MSDRDAEKLARMQAVVTALLEHRVGTSLAEVERALARWRAGEVGPLDAHGAVLKHAARCERVVERVTSAAASRPETILRDAFDSGLIDREEFVDLAGVEPDTVEPAGAGAEDEASTPPDKQTFVSTLLERGPVLVHVDARRDDVAVPQRFRGDPKLVLRFGHGLTPAIVDLSVDDAGIAGTLTFGGVPFHCVLPWSAVYAAVVEGEQRGMVWPEDIPDVLLVPPPRPVTSTAAPVPAAARPAEDPSRPGKGRGNHLKLVE